MIVTHTWADPTSPVFTKSTTIFYKIFIKYPAYLFRDTSLASSCVMRVMQIRNNAFTVLQGHTEPKSKEWVGVGESCGGRGGGGGGAEWGGSCHQNLLVIMVIVLSFLQ